MTPDEMNEDISESTKRESGQIDLDENLKETGKEFDDIKLKLDSIDDLPSGAVPINFIKDLRDRFSEHGSRSILFNWRSG